MKSKVWMGSLRPAPNQRLQPTRFGPSLRPALASPQPAVAGLSAADYIRLPACGSLMLASAYQADGADQSQARKRPSTGGSSAAPLGASGIST
jgi:hypothetical protein